MCHQYAAWQQGRLKSSSESDEEKDSDNGDDESGAEGIDQLSSDGLEDFIADDDEAQEKVDVLNCVCGAQKHGPRRMPTVTCCRCVVVEGELPHVCYLPALYCVGYLFFA